MNWLRLWLAGTWLIFATIAPAHAASMAHSTCDHMAMSHAPAKHIPAHDDSAMPCCAVPMAIPITPGTFLTQRTFIFVKLSPVPIHNLIGVTPAADPPPPK